jgi:hypothetical protein
LWVKKNEKGMILVVCLLGGLFLVNTSNAVQYEIIDLGTLGGNASYALCLTKAELGVENKGNRVSALREGGI